MIAEVLCRFMQLDSVGVCVCFDGLKQEIDSVSAFTLSLSGLLGHPPIVICTMNHVCASLCSCAHTHSPRPNACAG